MQYILEHNSEHANASKKKQTRPLTSSDEDEDDRNELLERENDGLSESYFSSLYEENKPKKLMIMNLKRRQAISACQWISFFLFMVIGIIALVDVCLAPSDPQYYLYLNIDNAVSAGQPYAYSHVGIVPYIVLQSVITFFSCLGGLLEFGCYNYKFFGIDMKWSIYPIKLLKNNKRVIAAIERAQASFSPYADCYDNYFSYVPLLHLSILSLMFLHITFGYDIISFTPIFTSFAFLLCIIVFFYMLKTYKWSWHDLERFKIEKEIIEKNE